MPYLGKTPSQATRQRYYKTASGGETSISGTMTTGGTLTFNDGEFVDVSVNGVALVAGTDYNTNTANTIAGLSALSANDQVEIVVYDTLSVFSGDVDSNLSVGGNLSVTGTSALTGAATLTAGFTASDGCTITTADNDAQLTLISTDADASAGPLIKMHRESGSPADGDALGRFNFIGENDADEEVTYARIHAKANDVTDGTEDGELLLLTTVAGTNRSRMAIGPSETVFNEDSVDVDFRVESNANANMFFLDANGEHISFGTTNGTVAQSNITGGLSYKPAAQLEVSGNGTQAAFFNRTDTGNLIGFMTGSSSVGAISVTGSGTTYHTTSDRRLKENIEPLVATDKLMAMNPVSYTWKAFPDEPRSMGFIAQEMAEVMPEAVSTNEHNDMMSMDYGRITPILVSALQDAHRKIEQLEQRIANMESK